MVGQIFQSYICLQVDEFELAAVTLGELKRCVVSHDGIGLGAGWFCVMIVVRAGRNEFVFPCNR